MRKSYAQKHDPWSERLALLTLSTLRIFANVSSRTCTSRRNMAWLDSDDSVTDRNYKNNEHFRLETRIISVFWPAKKHNARMEALRSLKRYRSSRNKRYLPIKGPVKVRAVHGCIYDLLPCDVRRTHKSQGSFYSILRSKEKQSISSYVMLRYDGDA